MDTQAADGHSGDKEKIRNDTERRTCLYLLVGRQGNPVVSRELHHYRADIGDADVTICGHHCEGIANLDGLIFGANLGTLNQEGLHPINREQGSRPENGHEDIDMP